MFVPDCLISALRRLTFDVTFKWIHTQAPGGSGLTKHSHLRQGQNNHHPELHYLPLKNIPLRSMVFRNPREGNEGEERVGSVRGMREEKSSVTGFQGARMIMWWNHEEPKGRAGWYEEEERSIIRVRSGLNWELDFMRFSFTKYEILHQKIMLPLTIIADGLLSKTLIPQTDQCVVVMDSVSVPKKCEHSPLVKLNQINKS